MRRCALRGLWRAVESAPALLSRAKWSRVPCRIGEGIRVANHKLSLPRGPCPKFFPNVGNRNWDRSEFSALGLGLFLDLWKAKAKASTAARVQAALTAERVCGGFAVTTLTKHSRIANAHESARHARFGPPTRAAASAATPIPMQPIPMQPYPPRVGCRRMRHGTRQNARLAAPTSLGSRPGRLAGFYHAACTIQTVLVRPGMSSSKCKPVRWPR